jgi:hypothetical protein
MKDNGVMDFGANPPPGREWMIGRTVLEIHAINAEAEATGKPPSEVASGEEWKKRLPVPNEPEGLR